MAETIRTDALIIGAGTGGYPAGIRLGQLGLKAIVVDKQYAGGVCLNVGCIPSKALIHAAKMFDKLGHSEELGIRLTTKPEIDWAQTIKWKESVVAKLTGGVKTLLKANKAEFLEGTATVVARGATAISVDVAKASGEIVRIECKNLVIATGSRPIQIPGFVFDGKRIIDSTGALALTSVPKRMAVVGGGYIGLELGMVYAKLGTKVTVVEALPALLATMDQDCVAVVAKKLKKMGVEVLLEAKAQSWEDKGDRAVLKAGMKDGTTVNIDADVILVTVGRKPVTDGFGLDKLGIKVDARGFITTDKQQRTNVPNVYAVGDCTPGLMLAHKASKEGEIVAEVIAGHKAEQDARVIPAIVFTDPEIASVGLMEAEAKAAGHTLKVGKFPFAALGRALTMHDTDGFVKVIADAESQEILGVHIVGNGASDIIAEAGLAMEMGAVLEDVALTVHAHPSMPEALMEAAKAALGEAIHIVNR